MVVVCFGVVVLGGCVNFSEVSVGCGDFYMVLVMGVSYIMLILVLILVVCEKVIVFCGK